MAADGVAELAPAKINLFLHVTGRRADGYHLLDSLVVFAALGDVLSARSAPALSLALAGPFAPGLPEGADNLALRAARVAGAGGLANGLAIRLDKRLPPASGIGGGSADAAAVLRIVERLAGRILPGRARLAESLGADVTVCLDSRPARMDGIGERVRLVAGLPDFWCVLANPGQGLATRDVFARLEGFGPPAPELPAFRDAAELAAWLGDRRNDLEAPARALCPAIGDVLGALRAAPGTLLARMSGSGATCLALHEGAHTARAAAAALAARHPGWWTVAAPVPGRGPATRLDGGRAPG